MTVSYAPIITSLLDNDLYKFTMLQAMLHQFPQTHGVYRFRCRNTKMPPIHWLISKKI